jgi:dolichol kinase
MEESWMKGENYKQEYKYPIKVYHIWSIEFANGLEVRKMIFAIVLVAFLLLTFILVGIKNDTNLFRFFVKNWLILLTVIPGVITFIVFNLKYDHKGVLPFIRDRITFYRTRKKSYEHFIEVAHDQLEKEMTFELFFLKKAGESR